MGTMQRLFQLMAERKASDLFVSVGAPINIKLNGYSIDITVGEDNHPHYTERSIAHPLPTEEGATILASYNEQPPHVLLTREADRWVNRYGTRWSVDQIASWAPVTIGETVVLR